MRKLVTFFEPDAAQASQVMPPSKPRSILKSPVVLRMPENPDELHDGEHVRHSGRQVGLDFYKYQQDEDDRLYNLTNSARKRKR